MQLTYQAKFPILSHEEGARFTKNKEICEKKKEWYRDNVRKIKIVENELLRMEIGCLNRRKGDEKEKSRDYNISGQCSYKYEKIKSYDVLKGWVLMGKGHDFSIQIQN